jgi:uncharacterized protein (DUF1330 family)
LDNIYKNIILSKGLLMAVYAIGEIKNIIDKDKWLEYKSRVKQTIELYDGKVLFRGEHVENFAGDDKYAEVVALEFETLEKAKEWFNSKEYQDIISIRQMGAQVNLNLFQ